jgi:hypothetical protein
MHFFYIFITISVTLKVSAIPLPVNSDDRSISYGPMRNPGRPPLRRPPLQDPKVGFSKHARVPLHDQDNTKAEVLNDFHQFSMENPQSARMTKLAHVPEDWVYLQTCQRLKVRYCEGKRPVTRTVPDGHRTIYRDIPPEKPLKLSFNRKLSVGETRELTGHITKYYNALPPKSPYRRAELTRVGQGWRPGGGDTGEIRDHVKFKSHSARKYTDDNVIGEPHIIRRPLTVSFLNDVNPGLRGVIEHRVREQHKTIMMDPTDEAKSSNVALVEGGSDGNHEARVGYFEFPDRPVSQGWEYKGYKPLPV